jgi:hypothetical protein
MWSCEDTWIDGVGHADEIQGSFFWLQNMEGEPVVGGWLQIHQPQIFPPYFVARKKNLDEIMLMKVES